MIKPELGCNGKRLSASKSLGRRQKDLFFHADVAKKPGSKLSIRALIDMIGICHSRLK
jgi:hypothetical protein